MKGLPAVSGLCRWQPGGPGLVSQAPARRKGGVRSGERAPRAVLMRVHIHIHVNIHTRVWRWSHERGI